MYHKLWNRDFVLVVLGQIISLFGNAVLRMVLPLYLLEQTGSPGLYAAVSACAFVPMIVLSPAGGLIADRVDKRGIMVALDCGTAALAALCAVLTGHVPTAVLVCPALILLYGIQGAYQPAVQASIPLLHIPAHIPAANAVISQVSAGAGLIGPVLGGLLYAACGLRPVLAVCAVCFFCSAVMELFIRIPRPETVRTASLLQTVRHDLSNSIRFIRHGQPILAQVMGVAALFNLFISALLVVGLPILVTGTLGLSPRALGVAMGALSLGGLLGGVRAAVRPASIQASGRLLLLSALLLVPVGLTFQLDAPITTIFVTLCICSCALMACSTLLSVLFLSYVQTTTPPALSGKVISCLLTIALCAQPLGQVLYGQLLEHLPGLEGMILLAAALGARLTARRAVRVFAQLPAHET